jgi:hypothetical protein
VNSYVDLMQSWHFTYLQQVYFVICKLSRERIDNICSVISEFLYRFNAVWEFHAFWKLELTWKLLIKPLWFWRIVWNLRKILFSILNPYTLDFLIFYFMHFEICFVNFEVFDVLFSLYVHTYIVSFQLFFFKHILNLNFVYMILSMLFHLVFP